MIRLVVPLLVTPVLALALAACGGSDQASDPAPTVTVVHTVTSTPTDSPPATEATTTPPVTVTVTETPTDSASDTASDSASDSASAPAITSSAPPSVDLSQPPTTLDEAVAHLEAGTATTEAKRFMTPSDNIYCSLKSPYFGAACELGDGGIEDTAYCGNGPASTAIGRIEYQHHKPTAVCNSDTIRQGGAHTIDYGTVVSEPGAEVTCIVEQIGVTCVDADASNGFFLAKGQYAIF